MDSYKALAASYDRLTRDVNYADAVNFYFEILKRENVRPRTAADLACGTGSVMACADSPGRMLNTSGHTPGHSPHWIQVSRWTYACIFLPPFAKQIGDIMPANRGN